MISSSPAQQPTPPPSKEPEVNETPSRRRPGQSPTARFIKGIFRPIFKFLYYLLTAIRNHKVLTLILLLLLLASIITTNFLTTGQMPFGVGSDPFDFRVHGTNVGGDKVRNWLYALRDGDVTTLVLLDGDMSSPPSSSDLSQYVSQFGQTKSRTWKNIEVLGVTQQEDTSVDSFIKVEMSSTGPGGKTDGIVIWHFLTITSGREYLLSADVVDFRRPMN